KVEAPKLGPLETDWKSHGDEGDERRPDDEREAAPKQRELSAGTNLAALGPKSQRDRRDHAQCQDCDDRAGPLARHRRGQDDPAIIEKNLAEERDALTRSGQRAQHGEIPNRIWNRSGKVRNDSA